MVVAASDEVEGGEGEAKGEVFDDTGAFESGGGVAMQIEQGPLALILRLEEGQRDGLVLVANHEILPFVSRLVEYEGAASWVKLRLPSALSL